MSGGFFRTSPIHLFYFRPDGAEDDVVGFMCMVTLSSMTLFEDLLLNGLFNTAPKLHAGGLTRKWNVRHYVDFTGILTLSVGQTA